MRKILIILMILSLSSIVTQAIDSDELDSLCAKNNQILYRYNGNWQCLDATTIVAASTGSSLSNGQILYHSNTCGGASCDFIIHNDYS